jgi:hypothetical protein
MFVNECFHSFLLLHVEYLQYSTYTVGTKLRGFITTSYLGRFRLFAMGQYRKQMGPFAFCMHVLKSNDILYLMTPCVQGFGITLSADRCYSHKLAISSTADVARQFFPTVIRAGRAIVSQSRKQIGNKAFYLCVFETEVPLHTPLHY